MPQQPNIHQELADLEQQNERLRAELRHIKGAKAGGDASGVLPSMTAADQEEYELLRVAGRKARIGGWNVILSEDRSYWSDEVAAIHEMPAGYHPLVKDGINFYAPEWRHRITEVFSRCVSEGTPYDEEMEILTATGKRLWVRTVGEAVRDHQGKIYKIQGAFQDITDRKLVEGKLREGEVRYRAIFESAGTAMIILNEDTTIAMANSECFRMFGHRAETLVGLKWPQFVAPESMKQMVEYHHSRREDPDGAPTVYEARLLNANGEIRDAVLHVSMIPGTKQSMVSMLDITDRNKAEAQLQKSEEKYRLLFINNPQPMWVYDIETLAFLQVNKAAIRHYGYSHAEFLQMTLKDIRPKEEIQALIEDVRNTTSSLSSVGRWHHIKKNGDRITVEVISHATTFNDRKARHVLIHDVSNEHVFENTRRVLLEISSTANQYYTLHSFLEHVHYKIKEVIRADNFYVALYNEQDQTYTFPYHVDAWDIVELDTPHDFRNGYTDHVLQNNQSMIISPQRDSGDDQQLRIKGYGDQLSVWLGVPLRSAGEEKPIGVLAIQDYNDLRSYSENDRSILEIIAYHITGFIERIKYLEELVHAKNKAEESDRLKSAFLANMSHEIRTPMNGILGFTELLKAPDLDNEEKDSYIDYIRISGQRLLDTVNDIVEVSRLEAGLVSIYPHTTHINDLLLELVRFFGPEAGKREVELLLAEKLPEANAIQQADEKVLYSILSNLIKNAIKYTQKGSISIGCGMESGGLRFFVRDTGIGIPKSRQHDIFERFTQVDNSDTRVFEGSGLGLSICRAYIEMMKGRIWVDSEPGKGSTFYFTMPLGGV